MSNLNTKSKSDALNIAALAVAIGALAFSVHTAHSVNETEAMLDRYGVEESFSFNLNNDDFFGTPNQGPEQQEVGAYFIEGGVGDTPPHMIQAPTAEFPYGDLEGSRVSIVIETDGSVWSAFENSIVGLSPTESEDLTRNLVRKLEVQEGRMLDLVNAGDVFRLDLKVEPSRYESPILPGEFSSEGRVELPQGSGYNPNYDGTLDTNPTKGMSAEEEIPASGEYGTGSIMPPVPPCDPRSLTCRPDGN